MNAQFPPKVLDRNTAAVGAFAVGLMLSPETLVRMGSYFGTAGFVGVIPFIFAVIFCSYLAKNFRPYYSTSESNFFYGFTHIFHFCVKFAAACILSTGMLVTCGFIFNEVFLYWFPNFAFAFILLGILTILQFLSKDILEKAQMIFVIIPAIGLSIIIINALFHLPGDFFYSHSESSSFLKNIEIFLLPIIIFAGFDLGFRPDTPVSSKGIYWGIIGIGILFLFWALISLLFVPGEKLADSTIPHILTAKAAMGGTGRYIMGITVISGTLAALNALFHNLYLQAGSISRAKKDDKNKKAYGKSIVLGLAVIIALMMTGGIAGDERIDMYAKAVLLLWIVSYALISLSPFIFFKLKPSRPDVRLKIKVIVIELTLWLAVITLILYDNNPILISKFLFGAGIIISSVSIFAVLGNRHKHSK